MIDLSTTYLGLKLKNPVVVSSNPLCKELDMIRRMEDVGAAAVVLHSLFEEQLDAESHHLDRYLTHGTESYAESLNYFPEIDEYKLGPEEYLDHIERAKKAVDIPIIASLNGVTSGGWIDYARRIESAGADALELNIYFVAANLEMSSAAVDALYYELVQDIRKEVGIPLAVKLSPYFSSPGYVCRRLAEAGANGLVLFNRFYQPDFDLEHLTVVPHLTLSSPHELLLRLHWTALLHGRVEADIAITGGVHHGTDVIKCMMAGAKVAMVASALMKHGFDQIRTILEEAEAWMKHKEYESISQMQGSMSQANVAEPAAFERANYIKVLSSYLKYD